MFFNVAESDDDSTVFDDKNIQIYRVFEKAADFNSNSKKKTVKSLKFDNDFMMCFDNFENDILQHTSIKNIFLNITLNTLFIKNTSLDSASMIKHFLKSKNFYQSKNLKYKIYTNILTKIYLNNETKLDFCYDTESKFFLIWTNIVRDHYAKAEVFQMNNEQKIRCQSINDIQKSNLCAIFFIKNLTTDDVYIHVKKKFYIMNELFCSLMTKTNFMKFYYISFKWKRKKENNSICIQKKHQITKKMTKNVFSRTKRIFETEIIIELSIKATKISRLKKRQTNVYAAIAFILKKIKKKTLKYITNH